MDYDWRRFAFLDLRERFAETEQSAAWSDLVKALGRADFPGPALSEDALREAWNTFLQEAGVVPRTVPPAQSWPRLAAPPSKPCVFISHQRRDTRHAKRLACLAKGYGLDTWLDVYDP